MTARDRARRIEFLLMDVDGTLTDGTVTILPDGEEVRAFHVRDGLGILLAQTAGLRTGIITGKSSKCVERRAERLRMAEVCQGAVDKKAALEGIRERSGVPLARMAFIGDDLGDLAVLRSVGLAGAVGDAHPEIKKHCHYVCRAAGGRGAVREFIEFILKAQGKWAKARTQADSIKGFRP